jgi:hypothetical protein
MATYLQGVTDFIPQFQPFQPDLNFYAKTLQTKQNQYDTNYKALNNVYGQYFYADLTHGDNLKKKDELLKAIDFNLKRVSGLDLSLQQNVDQATQVFKPFYQDKHLMKDMAWTKNKNSEREYGLGLKNNKDEKQAAKYWDDGLREIDYRTEEFKNSTLEETMNLGNVSYTPYLNIIEKAQKIAKDNGFDKIEAPIEFDGKFIVKTTGGREAIVEPLMKLLQAQFSSDPAVADVYKTQAYLNRKDYMYQNAAVHGGDVNLAEREYLTKQYNNISQYSKQRYENSKNEQTVNSNREQEVTKSIESGDANINTNAYLEQLKKNIAVTDAVLANDETVNNIVNTPNSRTLSTTTGDNNPFSDIASLRQKVDVGTASLLLSQDIQESALIFADSHVKVDYQANPFALQAEAHMYRVDEAQRTRQAQREDDDLKFQRDILLKGVDTGSKVINAQGQIVDNENVFQTFTLPGANSGAGAADPNSGVLENREQKGDWAKENVTPWLSTTMNMLSNELSSTNVALPVVSAMLKGTTVRDELIGGTMKMMTPAKFLEEYNKNPTAFLNTYGTAKLIKLKQAIDAYAKSQNARESVATYINNMNYSPDGELSAGLKMSTYTSALKGIYQTDIANRKTIVTSLKGVLKSQGIDDITAEKIANSSVSGLDLIDKTKFLKNTAALAKNLPKKGEDKYLMLNNMDNVYSISDITNKPNNLTTAQQNELKKRIAAGKAQPKESAWYKPNDTGAKIVNDYINELNSASDIESVYNSLNTAYTNIVKSNEIKRYDVVGRTSAGGKTAKYSMDLQAVEVLPKVPGAVGNAIFNETIRDIQNFNQSDSKNYTATFSGISKGTLDASKAMGNAHTQKIINLIQVLSQRETPGRSYVQHAIIAGEDSNKSAMIFKFSPETYKDLIITKTNPTGLITEDEANSAMTYGISFVAPNNHWSNTLAKKSRMGPVEGVINAQGEKGFKYVSPIDPNNSYVITANANMPGGYSVQHKIRVLLSDGTWDVRTDYTPSQNYGGNIELVPAVLNNQIIDLESANNITLNQINQSKK